MNNNLLQQVALTLVPNIGPVQARILVDHFGDAAAIFKAKQSSLEKLEGIGAVRAYSIKSFNGFKKAEEELSFIEKYKISSLFLTDDAYPKRLLNCYDPPTLLYYRGKADLNASKTIAIIGTRSKTDYGKHLTEKLLAHLEEHKILVVSGLALGIDAVAQKASIKHHLPTVAVVAHGLDKIYPAEHTSLAKDIIKENGGLLTEFRSNSKPDKHNFPSRNRIVAGMCDATVVIETDVKGGSMITAE
ncbi:MAG: DNA-processing protein DprA, partial [Bacteroidota bacterium]